ncbi:MAG: hypothetical protein HY072_03865 [Deltaproteobacteria bacterium]|nr:hypothetical protein [Deltaproteobacteria bacterium]
MRTSFFSIAVSSFLWGAILINQLASASETLLDFQLCKTSYLRIMSDGTMLRQEYFDPKGKMRDPKKTIISDEDLRQLKQWVSDTQNGEKVNGNGPGSKGCKGYLKVYEGTKERILRFFYCKDAYYNNSQAASSIVRFVNNYVIYKFTEAGIGLIDD